MLVQFTTTGQVVDTDMFTFTKGPTQAARTWLVLDTNPADVALIGKRSSGTLLAITGLDAQAYLVWKSKSNVTTYKWKMNNAAAVTTAITNLLAAFSNAPAADVSVTLSPAGVVTAV